MSQSQDDQCFSMPLHEAPSAVKSETDSGMVVPVDGHKGGLRVSNDCGVSVLQGENSLDVNDGDSDTIM